MNEDHQKPAAVRLQDPYAILNVEKDSPQSNITASYKTLSRSFHPDKRLDAGSRDTAQEIFVEFKNAHDILTDPVLRQVYDDHGYQGIKTIRLSINSQDPAALYPKLQQYHATNQIQKARALVMEALETEFIEKVDRSVSIRSVMEFECSTQSTGFLGGEGLESQYFPELTGASVSVSANARSDSKWDMTVASSTNIDVGKAHTNGSISVGYKPHQGTQLTGMVDLASNRFSISSTRTLFSRTMVTVNARSIPNSRHLALSVVSHRDLLQNQLRGTWALGFGTNAQMHYGLLSLTTNYRNIPKCTIKLNVGVNPYPIKVTARHEFQHQTVYASYAYGHQKGIESKVILSRALTSYAQFSMGIKHSTRTGLFWLIQLERGDFVFRIPISISCIASPGYNFKLLYLSLLSIIIDSAIGEIIHDLDASSMQPLSVDDKVVAKKTAKTKQDAELQIALMKSAAAKKMAMEAASHGLVIYSASYFVPNKKVDVTIPLQFFVKNGNLSLVARPKSQLMGFHDISSTVTSRQRSWWWRSSSDAESIPQLSLRYAFGDSTYEVTVSDTDALHLPSPDALRMGPRDVVY